jgi:hypothetical protein
MLRRVFCLGALGLLILMCVPACERASNTKTQNVQPDPDPAPKPRPAGGKAG